MARQSKAHVTAERDELAKSAEAAARQLQVLAGRIEAAIVALPRFSKPGLAAELQQQADQAHAIAHALAVASKGSDADTTHLLMTARTACVTTVVAVVTVVGVGAAETAGGDVWRALKAQAAKILGDQPADPPLTSPDEPHGSGVPARRGDGTSEGLDPRPTDGEARRPEHPATGEDVQEAGEEAASLLHEIAGVDTVDWDSAGQLVIFVHPELTTTEHARTVDEIETVMIDFPMLGHSIAQS